MNDRTFDQKLDAWMDLGPTVAPERVTDAARLEIRTTRQTAGLLGWPPRRFPIMSNTVRLALAAVILAGASLLGYSTFIAPNIGDRTPVATESPAPSELPGPDLNEQDGSLTPGTYSVGASGHAVSFTVPSGWTKNVVDSVIWSQSSETRVSFLDYERLYADPCRRAQGLVNVGRTVDDLATALAALPGVDVVTSDVELSGHSGRQVEMAVPELTGCTGDEPMLDPDHRAPLEGGDHTFWIIDVEGDRLVIHAVARTASPERERRQLDAIVESIEIR